MLLMMRSCKMDGGTTLMGCGTQHRAACVQQHRPALSRALQIAQRSCMRYMHAHE